MSKVIKGLSVFAIATAASIAFCQEPGAAAEVVVDEAGLTFRQIMDYGGSLMYVLGALSVFAVANIIYLFVTLRSGVTVPSALYRDVIDNIKAGQFGEARKACDYKPSAFSSVAISAIDYAEAVPEADPIMLNNAIEGEGGRQAARIQSSTQWLLDVAAVAPMVGLLGTVIGMLTAFHAVSSEIATAKPVVLAQGVSQALITTIAGLFIAIPAMAFYAWFRRSASRQVANLECAASELLSSIISHRTK